MRFWVSQSEEILSHRTSISYSFITRNYFVCTLAVRFVSGCFINTTDELVAPFVKRPWISLLSLLKFPFFLSKTIIFLLVKSIVHKRVITDFAIINTPKNIVKSFVRIDQVDIVFNNGYTGFVSTYDQGLKK